MKKVIKILLLILLFIMLHILTNCRYMYGGEDFTEQNLRYVSHSFLPICFAGDYVWHEETPHAVMNILNDCNGHAVTSLGGHGTAPFLVNLQNSRYSCSESMLPANARIEQYHLVINLGKNIREAKYIDMNCYHCIGQNQFVQILVTVNCSEENPYFYSEDGKLYNRSDNSSVEGFFYYSDYFD